MYSTEDFLNGDFSALSLNNGNGTNGKDSSGIHPEKFHECGERGESSFQVDKRVLRVAAVLALIGAAAYYRISILLIIYGILGAVFDFIFNLTVRLWGLLLRNISRCTPIICGLIVGTFGWTITYFDSNIPGVQPPSPFSPRSKHRHRCQQTASIHLGYMTALASGLVVTTLMMFNNDFL